MQVPEVIDDGSNTEVDIQERVTVCIAESSQCFVNHLKKVIMISVFWARIQITRLNSRM